MTKKRIKLKGKINKIVLIISSIAIFVLLFFVIASKIYLSPVDKKDDNELIKIFDENKSQSHVLR